MGTTVIKIGGVLLSDAVAIDLLWSAVASMRQGRRVVVVHGGGARATEVARQLGHEPRIVHGRRVTSQRDLEIVQWTMRGELNGRLVAGAAAHGVGAVGVSGADGPILYVVKRPPWNVGGEAVDFGWVGDIESVDPTLLDILLRAGYVPVVAPIGVDDAGRLFNVNADTVSCAIAGALHADEFLLVTGAGGVRRAAQDPSTLLDVCDASLFERGKREGWISDGMRVKLDIAFEATNAGVSKVYIVPPEGILDRSSGTRILASPATE
jgi:acetylglutamate kinase